MKEPTFDSQGYPTEATLRAIRKWPFKEMRDTDELMRFCQKAWAYPDYFTPSKRRVRERWGSYKPASGRLVRRWEVSTGGWSGNESIISAMEQNFIFWSLVFDQHHRGGHYIFYTFEE